MLSEHEVSLMWRELFHAPSIGSEAVFKAEALLEELKLESPLRHRLSVELDEICTLRKIQREDRILSERLFPD